MQVCARVFETYKLTTLLLAQCAINIGDDIMYYDT